MKPFQKFALTVALIAASCSANAHDSCHNSHSEKHDRTCKPPKRIKHVPVKITKSGKYCVDRELRYHGCDAAIEICADNVTINFNNHDLKLKDPNATAILAKDVNELTILNDKISHVAPLESISGNLIYLENVNKATFDNIFLFNMQIGIFAQDCSDIHIINSQFRQSSLTHLAALATNGFVVDNCNFYNEETLFAYVVL